MASSSSSRRCSDAELQKALSDIDELVARRPIPDEFKFLDSKEEQKNDEKDGKKDERKKKKKLFVIPPKDVKLLLSYQCEESPEKKNLDRLAEEEKGNYQDLKTAVSAVQVLGRHYQDGIRATQEKIRHQLLTQGYVTYEATVTDDEAEEEETAAPVQQQQGGGGQRRHRPGIVKTAGGRARKIN
ncbi:hypothetical protein BS78_05G046400 [Paspalum vaginatum]|nr:hypothetical protein BS78_05G046400 [Paspalum vaginatum]